ncbi:triadin-like [Erinaceus europaeus]|uniref:Triadin-like n=1 Tax=Erinaceus europaeus TaxID=9365 RepID=A0ABM3XCG9_ERIEU|nr:triadin-like [Erinaceus europaeus]
MHVQDPDTTKIKSTKGKDVKIPASLRGKEPEIKKDEKMPRAGKEVKPKPPQTQPKKEEKPEPQAKKEVKQEQPVLKLEKIVSHGKPEEKVAKQVKATITEKAVKSKQAKKADQEKESPSIRTEAALEVTGSEKKKIEKYEKERKEKEKSKHPKEEKGKDTRDLPASVKAKEVAEDVSSTRKQKSPISFFQCVYLDGYNGYGFQFPVTPANNPIESPGQRSSPKQKPQGQ